MTPTQKAVARMMGFSGKGTIYTFHRLNDGAEYFYPVELADDEDARSNAESNPGTIRVEDIEGRVVWPVLN